MSSCKNTFYMNTIVIFSHIGFCQFGKSQCIYKFIRQTFISLANIWYYCKFSRCFIKYSINLFPIRIQ